MTVPAPEPDCWLHADVEVRPSPIAGRGLFARTTIPAGTVVSRIGGRLVATNQLRTILAEAAGDPDRYVDTISVAEDIHLVLPPRRANGYGNHSCDPNLWWTGPYTLAARRDITAGAELTNDYATSTAQPEFRMECGCGSPLCRGVVTGDDWLLPALQQRYGEHWVPVLLDRIRADGDARPGQSAAADGDAGIDQSAAADGRSVPGQFDAAAGGSRSPGT